MEVIAKSHLIDKKVAKKLMTKDLVTGRKKSKKDKKSKKKKKSQRNKITDAIDIEFDLAQPIEVLKDSFKNFEFNNIDDFINQLVSQKLKIKFTYYQIEKNHNDALVREHCKKTKARHLKYAKKNCSKEIQKKCKNHKYDKDVSFVIQILQNDLPVQYTVNGTNKTSQYFNFGRLCPPLCNT